jgi:N-acetylglucosaminyl-diphospho-decaprenol L-rhamnosyltransferase
VVVTGALLVVVTHASAGVLPSLWRSLMAQLPDLPGASTTGMRVCIIDSASGDDTVATAQRLVATAPAHVDAWVEVSEQNIGYAAAINRARRHRRPGEALVVLNPDLVLDHGCLPRLLGALDDASVGVAVPRLVDPGGRLLRSRRRHPTLTGMMGEAVFGDHWPTRPHRWAEVRRDDHTALTCGDVDWATGAVWAISPDCDDCVGDWDERFFLYGEEVDHARRAQNCGFRVRYVATAVAVHAEGGSGRRPELEALAWWNRIRDQRWHRGWWAGVVTWWIAIVHTALRCGRADQRAALGWLLPTRRRPVSTLLAELRGALP